jgi:hypothetical protein
MAALDPSLTFALGALCALTVILLIGFGVGIGLASWLWNRISECDDLGLTREDGKVKLVGTLVDFKRPASRARKARGPKTADDLMRRTSKGQLS